MLNGEFPDHVIGSEWVLHMSWGKTCLFFEALVCCHVTNSQVMGSSKVMLRFWDVSSSIPAMSWSPWLFTGGFNRFFVHFFGARGQLKP